MHEKSIFRTVKQCVSPRRRLAALCAAAAAAVLVGGCSSSGGGSTAVNAGTSTPASAASASGAAGSCVATATARASAAMAQTKFDAPSAFNASASKGKKFAVIPLTFTPTTEATGAAVKEALATVGADTIVLSGQGKPDVIAQDFQTAIAQHVAGIITVGIVPAIAPSAFTAAQAAKIPVVLANTGNPRTPLTGGIVAVVTPDAHQQGALEADYALVHTNCNLHAAVFFASTAALSVATKNGVSDEITKLCPTGCSLDEVPLSAATFPTTLAGQVQATLQHSPNINFLFSTADSFVPYILQGRNALGSQDPVAGTIGDGLPAAIAGSGETADVLQTPAAVTGYYCADAIMRAVAGAPKNQELPIRLVDSSNWGTSAAANAQFPDLDGYQAAFKKAWGV